MFVPGLGNYEPHDDDLEVILDLIKRRIITGLEWAGGSFTECLLPWGWDELEGELMIDAAG